jgi:glutathione S-transferase
MIKIHGVTISNYYNSVKLALVEKDIAFEEVSVFPSQEPDVLAVSPMGKVPWMEVDGAVLSETNVIFDYLEDVKPEPSLYPSDPFAKAKVKEIIRVIEQYVDAAARRHIATVYFGAPVDELAFKEARPAVENGLRALESVAKFAPYIAGEAFTFADITAYFQLRFANLHTTKVYEWDITESVPELSAYLAMLGGRPSVARVDSVMQEAMSAFLPK